VVRLLGRIHLTELFVLFGSVVVFYGTTGSVVLVGLVVLVGFVVFVVFVVLG